MTAIGIMGGSGFYSLVEEPEFIAVETKFGNPGDNIAVGRIGGVEVAFI